VQKFSLTCLGVGDGWSCADRNHAAFLYRFGATTLLLDCGEPVDRNLTAGGVDYNSIDGIFLSHLHSDHIGGFFMLMQGFWLQGRRRDLPVHLTGGAIKPLQSMLQALYLFDGRLNFRTRFVAHKAGRSVRVRNVQVTPFPTSHLDGLRMKFEKKFPVDFSAFCFLLQSSGLRIGHSGDLGRPEDLEPLLQRPLDLLVCELAHFQPQDLFLYLRGRAIKRIVFVHLARAYWEDLGKTRRLAAKMLPEIPQTFAHDGTVISL
jgi:ribonuclease BN (tRNA processing enzyme)